MIRAFCTCLLCAFFLFGQAQFPYSRAIDLRAGQQQPKIRCITQDVYGQIWAGSDLGLIRSDGEVVELIGPTEKDAVVAVAQREGAVYAAFSSGIIMRYTQLKYDTVYADTALARTTIRSLLIDANGTFFIGTYGYGLHSVHNGVLHKLTTNNGLPDDHVNDIAFLPGDLQVVVATDQGVAICTATEVLSVYGEAEGAPDNLVLSVAVDTKGTVWAGTDRKGVFSIIPDKNVVEPLRSDQPWDFGPVLSLAVNGDLMWIGTRNHRTVVYDRSLNGGVYRSAELGQHKEPILRIIPLHDGSVLWCNGTEELIRADPSVIFIAEHEGIDLRNITAICSDDKGFIWFATDQGLFSHSSAFGSRSLITRSKGSVPKGLVIVSLAASADGRIWAATFGNGVYAIDPNGNVEHFTQKNGIANDNVLAVRSDHEKVWCATLEGISEYTIAKRNWKHHEVVGPGFVYDVLPRSDGSLLAATDGNGIVAFDQNGKVVHEYVNGAKTYYMLTAIGDVVWAAGPRTGACSIIADQLDCVGAERIPFTSELFAFTATKNRLLAFGAAGVTAFDPATNSWTDLTERTGLEGSAVELNAICTDAEGTVWLGSDKGLVRLDVNNDLLKRDLQAHITGISVNNVPVPVAETISIPHDRNSFTVYFTANDLADPSSVRFVYQMAGHSNTSVRTRDREVMFNDLPPGNYQFYVSAISADGSEIEGPISNRATVAFIVERVWWSKSWFIIASLLTLALGVFLLVRTREKRQKERQALEQEKVRFQLDAVRSQVDPHFLFNSFNALVHLIETDTNMAVEHVDQLSIFFRNILQVRDLELITLEQELELLTTYFALEQRRFGTAISLVVDLPHHVMKHRIVPMTLQLLVENSLKHNIATPQRPLKITLQLANGELLVANEIAARRTPQNSTGFGLDSIRKRYLALTKTPVRVESTATHFNVYLPLIEQTK